MFRAVSLLLLTVLNGVHIEGKRRSIALSAETPAVKPGGEVTLAIEIDLKPGMHVYAPGVENYLPLAWTLKPSLGWTAREAVYPQPKLLHLEAIGETVPVFEGHLRLTRKLIVGPAQRGELTIEGALRAQACDDRMCYLPETLPLVWKLRVQ